ncbi:MAG: hypothetical protein D3910_24510 [Candidatus Electrothrix sp. ATG2]|nr:hypothetical protein [Candidatus Electrothrix sp. ATG2]
MFRLPWQFFFFAAERYRDIYAALFRKDGQSRVRFILLSFFYIIKWRVVRSDSPGPFLCFVVPPRKGGMEVIEAEC